jgi:16S rRNA (guanine527-N7)-methyltransferase
MRAATPHEAKHAAEALDRFGFVTDAVRHDLDRFVALLTEWQLAHNLVAPSTLELVWTRHVADSLQLLEHAPENWRAWVDLGSGAGFPGLVVAIANKDHAARHVTLVESNGKKAAFLRAAIRETSANAAVAAERIETHAQRFGRKADVVSARALAPLSELLKLAEPYCREDTLMLFLKGKEHVQEIATASQSWEFDVIEFESATDSGGRVLAIRNLRPKGRRS